MGWNDIDKKLGGGIGGRMVQFDDKGTPVRMRILDEEPYATRVHKITQLVTKGGKTEEVFRTITATQSPDDSYIVKMNGKRYPELQLHNIRGWVYTNPTDQKDLSGEFKVLQGGVQIFKQLREIYKQNGHLNQYDIVIVRSGVKRDTEYNVTAAPFSRAVNADELTAKLQDDASLTWENLFVPITGEQQKKIVEEAGFDIMYDPAASIAQGMSWDDAAKTKFTFGKYKDKPIGELVVIDAGYVEWAAENVHTNDAVAAACRVAVRQMSKIESGSAPVQQIAAPAEKASAPSAGGVSKAQLVEEIGGWFESDPRFEDMDVMLTLVKKHTGGKTRLKDATEPQLVAILAEVKGNG